MTEKLRRILTRQSEAREALNALLAKDELSDDDKAALASQRTTMEGIEKELRDALEDEPEPAPADQAGETEDAEARERRELREKCHVADFVSAALQGRDAAGEAAEYAASMGCPGLMPLTMIERRERRAETRAVTPAPADADLPHTHAPIVPAIFDRSVAGFLGIEMPTVETGIRSYPVLNTNVRAGMRAEDADAPDDAGGFEVTDADPRRLTGSFVIRKEDIAKLPNLEPALNENLVGVLSDELDKQVVNGNNVAPNLNGLLAQLTDPDAPAAGDNTFAAYVQAFASHIDGLYAATPMQVRALVGPHTMRRLLSTYAAANQVRSAYAEIGEVFGGARATRRIADPPDAGDGANIQQAIIVRNNPAGDRVAVAPVWMGVELIRDMYGDNAMKGHITVTATALVGGVVLLRGGVFVQDSFRVQ